MKNTGLIILFLHLIVAVGNAHVYYMSPAGTDDNTGTHDHPMATLQKLQDKLLPGDTVYIRGGLYRMQETHIAKKEKIFASVTYLDKSGLPGKPIRYWAFPGEKPVFDYSAVKPADFRVIAFNVVASWIHLRGLEITGVKVTIKGHTQSECFENHGSNNIYEMLSMHDGMAIGFYLLSGSNNLVLNCDAWRNWDDFSENGRGGNTDGFGSHPSQGSKGNVFRGCRAWFNSDDGFDVINSQEATTFEHCWAFYNGFSSDFKSLGDGNGFKGGGYGNRPAEQVPAPVPVMIFRYCLAVDNKANGFYANHHIGGSIWQNNSACRNGINFNMLCRLKDNITDVPGYGHELVNNLGYMGHREVQNLDSAACKISHNYFNLQLFATDADFVNLDEKNLVAARNADGSLPRTGFMQLTPNSRFAGRGISADGNATDIGAFPVGK